MLNMVNTTLHQGSKTARKTAKSRFLKGIILCGAIIGMNALTLAPQTSSASIITTGCAQSGSCTMTELFSGGSIQIDDLLFTDWALNWNQSVNLNNIEIGAGYTAGDDFGVWARQREMFASNYNWKGIGFDFKVTSLGATAITAIETKTAFSSVQGWWMDNPYTLTSITAGTSQGSNDLGSTLSYFALVGGQYIGSEINISELTSLWIRQEIRSVPNGYGNSAEAGYLPSYGEGPGYRTIFTQTVLPQSSIPEPNTIGLLALGLAGLICVAHKRGWDDRQLNS